MHIDIAAGFDAYIAANQKTWNHDRTQSLGASEVFGCLRKAWYAKHNTAQDDDYEQSWGATTRGDVIENSFVVPAMRHFVSTIPGAQFLYGGEDQVTFKDGRLSATPDGLIVGVPDDALANYGIASLGGTGCFTFEIKSIDPRVNLKEEKTIHRGQVQVQMGLIRAQTEYRPNFALILYVDASFFDDLNMFVVPFDQQAYDAARHRADEVYRVQSPTQIMAEGRIDGGCDYCPFKRSCNATNKAASPTDSLTNSSDLPMDLVEEFEALVLEEREAAAEKKAAETRAKRASEYLKNWFRETGVKRAVTSDGKLKASMSWVKGRITTDIQAMKRDGIDVESYGIQGEGFDRLFITEKGSTKPDDV
jgi:CRISPR/Cas system-associated exonuclease Cas4 (RecB family)